MYSNQTGAYRQTGSGNSWGGGGTGPSGSIAGPDQTKEYLARLMQERELALKEQMAQQQAAKDQQMMQLQQQKQVWDHDQAMQQMGHDWMRSPAAREYGVHVWGYSRGNR